MKFSNQEKRKTAILMRATHADTLKLFFIPFAITSHGFFIKNRSYFIFALLNNNLPTSDRDMKEISPHSLNND